MKKISIIIPVFNEKRYVAELISRVQGVNFAGLEKEIIIIDDGSNDGTREILEQFLDRHKIIFHSKTQGKGAALRSGFKISTGDIIAVQDADLEYNPEDLNKLAVPIVAGQAKVVYGSRMIGKNPIGHLAYYFGNKFISLIARILYNCRLTDIETCYKVFSRDVLTNFDLESNDFGFDPEFTAKVLKNKIAIIELPISYSPRKFNQGKKIGWHDGLKAIWLLIKYRFK